MFLWGFRSGKWIKETDSESIAMETLYDLLGALPNDDADELRAASVARSSESILTSIRKTWMPDLNSAESCVPTRFSAMPSSVPLMIIC